MRSPVLALIVGIALAAAGCGGSFELPEETPGGVIPEAGSYAYQGSIRGLGRPTDVLLTLGTGSSLFIVGDSSYVRQYPRFFRPDGATPPISTVFTGFLKPTKITQGPAVLFVLDAGDTLLARTDTTKAPGFLRFGLTGGAPTFVRRDTSIAEARGIAADADGNVYVSCIAKEFIRDDPLDPRRRTFKYVSRVYRYLAAQGYARDAEFYVGDGQGIGIVFDPGDCFVRTLGGTLYLYVADTGKDLCQRMTVVDGNGGESLPSLPLDGSETGVPILIPPDFVADDAGFMYAVDLGSRRILRFDATGAYVQKVNIELDLDQDSLHVPIAVSADDTLAYVADRATGKVTAYKKRK
jgi:DNA-binding beta-propeller fold protein YncE